MTTKSKFRPSPALVISCVALFMALVGTAFAAPKLAIRSAQIVNGTVRTIDLRDSAVSSPKIADATVTAADLGTDSVGSEEIAKDAVNTDEIAKDAVKSDEIAANAVASDEVAPDSLTAGDLAANSVGSSEVADQSLTANDLGADSVGSSELQAGSVRASELGTIISVTNSVSVATNSNAGVTATCPAGTTVISGGGQPSSWNVPVVSTLRSGNGWLYQARNTTATTQTLTAYAYCLTGGSSN
jgi:hypothetical protein